MKRLAALVLTLLLTACTSLENSTPIPRGEVVSAPGGWIKYCEDEPEDEQC